MKEHEVVIRAEWQNDTTFFFDTQEEADEFRELVNAGGEAGLDAIIEKGDVFSDNCSLVDWEAI